MRHNAQVPQIKNSNTLRSRLLTTIGTTGTGVTIPSRIIRCQSTQCKAMNRFLNTQWGVETIKLLRGVVGGAETMELLREVVSL